MLVLLVATAKIFPVLVAESIHLPSLPCQPICLVLCLLIALCWRAFLIFLWTNISRVILLFLRYLWRLHLNLCSIRPKQFYNIGPQVKSFFHNWQQLAEIEAALKDAISWNQYLKTFFRPWLLPFRNKLECLPLPLTFTLV